MKPILFLDIDGVLNHSEWVRKTGEHRLMNPYLSREELDVLEIDPAAVEILNRIIEASGAVVVISSAWRLIRTLEEIDRALKARGFKGEIVGKTPSDRDRCRGDEIRQYLDDLEACPVFAIIDDDTDMSTVADRHVKTEWETGLQTCHVEAVINLFIATS